MSQWLQCTPEMWCWELICYCCLLRKRFEARSPFSPRDSLLRSGSPGEASLCIVNNYSTAHSKRGEKKRWTNWLTSWRSGHLWESRLQTPALMNIELFMCSWRASARENEWWISTFAHPNSTYSNLWVYRGALQRRYGGGGEGGNLWGLCVLGGTAALLGAYCKLSCSHVGSTVNDGFQDYVIWQVSILQEIRS